MPRIQYAGISSVGDKPVDTFVAALPTVHCTAIQSTMRLPFRLAYASPDTLGTDRLCAVAGALQAAGKGPLLALTAGTALTINRLNSDGEMEGGSIHPGLHLRSQALHQFTARLPLINPDDSVPLTGRDTVGSLRAGIQTGFVAEVEAMIAAHRAELGAHTPVYLTGGDAAFLGNHLKTPTFVDSNLQLRGICFLLQHIGIHE